jgi:hypothetical protein
MNTVIPVILSVSILILAGCHRNVSDVYTTPAPGEELVTKDMNKDGRIDNWIVRGTNGIPLRWVQDENRDGKPDSWSFFKGGKAFLDEVDSDHDGKVDTIYLHVSNEDNTRVREFCFHLQDEKRNVFIEREDTGWGDLNKQDK